MRPTKLKGTVTMPRDPARGMDILDWAKGAHRAIRQLKDRVVLTPSGSTGSGSTHPFKISVSKPSTTWTISVADGIVSDDVIASDTNGEAVPLRQSSRLVTGDMTGIADNSVWGIWMQHEVEDAPAFSENVNAVGTFDGDKVGAGMLLMSFGVGSAFIDKDGPTLVNATDAAAKVAATNALGFIYVGKVTIAAGVVTIDQWLRENVTLPTATWAHGILSNDVPNDLNVGTDGGLQYELDTSTLRDAGPQ